MAHRTIGRLMPSRIPAGEAKDKFVFKEKQLSAPYNIFNELTPKRLQIILRDAEEQGRIGELQKVYDKMLVTDTHYSGLIGQVERAVARLPLKVVPSHGATPQEEQLAKDYAQMMEEVLAQLDTHSLTKQFIDPFHKGVRLFQIRWEMKDYPYGRKIWFPDEIESVDGKYLKMDPRRTHDDYGKLLLKTKRSPRGELIENFDYTSFICLKDIDARGNYHRVGVARKCLPWFLGIQFIRSWWIQYIENYAAPLRIGKYPAGASSKSKNEMEKFLRVLGRNGYALFPSEMEVQLIEASRHGSVTTYNDFIDKGEQEMTIHILGQGDTVAENRNGSFARTKETASIRYETLDDVAKISGKGYRQLTDRVLGVNYGNQYIKRLRPTIRPLVIRPGDMRTKVEAANAVQEKGVPVPQSYYYDQVLGEAPREGEPAVVYGQVFTFGDEMPKSPMEREDERAEKEQEFQAEQNEAERNANQNESDSERSSGRSKEAGTDSAS